MKVKTIKGSARWSAGTKGGNWLTMELGAEAELSAREKPESAFPKLMKLLREQLNARWIESNKHGAPAPKLSGKGAGTREELATAQVLDPDGKHSG